MNIVFVWTGPIKACNGGVERVTSILISGLENLGHRCIVLEVKNRTEIILHKGVVISDLKELLVNEKIDVIVSQDANSSVFGRRLRRDGWRGALIVASHTEPTFLLKVFDFRRVMYELMCPASSALERAKWLMRLGLYPFWRFRTRTMARRIAIENYRNCDHVVLLSHRLVKYYKNVLGFCPNGKLSVIPNPAPKFDGVRSIPEAETKKNIVLVVARLFEPEKRVSLILQAWKRLQKMHGDWQLVVVGDGPDKRFYQQFAIRAGLLSVQFIGHDDPAKFYREAALLFVTSKTEGWNLSIVEAQHYGVVPIVMASYLSLFDLIEDGYNGRIVADGDINEFVSRAHDLMADRLLRQKYASAARSSVQRFEVDSIISRWEQLLLRCARDSERAC